MVSFVEVTCVLRENAMVEISNCGVFENSGYCSRGFYVSRHHIDLMGSLTRFRIATNRIKEAGPEFTTCPVGHRGGKGIPPHERVQTSNDLLTAVAITAKHAKA